MSIYSIYVVRCRDNSLYTGISTDVARRLSEHQQGARGAKYLRGKGPLTLVFQQEVGDRSLATRTELYIKRLPSIEKGDIECLSRRVTSFIEQCTVVGA